MVVRGEAARAAEGRCRSARRAPPRRGSGPDRRGDRGDREAGDVPGGGQLDQRVALSSQAAAVVAVAAQRRRAFRGRLEHDVDVVVGEPALPRRRHLGPLLLRAEVGGDVGERTAELHELADARAVAVERAGVAGVVVRDLGEQDHAQLLAGQLAGTRELDHAGTELLARAPRVLERVGDVGLEAGLRRALGERHRHAAERPRRRACAGRQVAERRGGRHERRRLRRSAGERAQERPAVGERARHRTRMVERRRERDDAAHRHAPVRRLDRAHAAQRRRYAQRARCVGAEAGRDHRRGQRRAGAAARSTRRPSEVPRIADLVRRAAGGELVRVRMADQHHALVAQASPGEGARVGDVAGHDAAGGGQRRAVDGEHVLERDRDAAEGWGVGPVARAALVRGAGLSVSGFAVEPHEGVDGLRRAVERRVAPVSLTDPPSARGEQLARRQRPSAKKGDRVQQVQISGVGDRTRVHDGDHPLLQRGLHENGYARLVSSPLQPA
jgi:hypothetical protein